MADELSLAIRFEQLSLAFQYPRGRYLDDAGELPESLARAAARTGLEQLEAEHVRLFVNALPEVPCPPYASVYLDGCLLGPSAQQLRSMYRRYGVEPDELPDHVAAELAFLAALLAAGDEPGPTRIDRQWLSAHLREWCGRFLERVEAHDRSGFYREAAALTRQALAELEGGALQVGGAPPGTQPRPLCAREPTSEGG